MLVLSLIFYIVLLFAANFTGVFLLFPLPWYGYLTLYLVSVLLVRFSFALIRSFQEELIPFVKKTCLGNGLRYTMFFAAALSGIMLFVLYAEGDLSQLHVAFLLPVGVVSVLNLLHVEFLPKFIREYDDSINITIPALFPDWEGDATVRPKPEDGEGECFPDEGKEVTFDKHYRWEYDSATYSIDLPIRPSVYEQFRSLRRVYTDEWAKEYASKGIVGEVKLLAQKLMQAGQPQNSFAEVAFVLSFAQGAVRYEYDSDDNPNSVTKGEYPKYPVETLVEECGDCEDSSILGAALLKVMGYNTALIFAPSHCALGIAEAEGFNGTYVEHANIRYYYCETTATGWKIGEMPEKYNLSDMTISPVP